VIGGMDRDQAGAGEASDAGASARVGSHAADRQPEGNCRKKNCPLFSLFSYERFFKMLP